ncbi:hypothetical protein Tco_0651635 [Tanacetum coccineum]|uniref:Reverse transcriptase domain-containing protein n=1 Tax=Tanacetum coccineum TaxID=301880 RepID=A0ABQ4WW00_9ASTR
MRTRNSNFPNNSNVTIPRRRNRGRAPNIVEPELRTIVEVAPMAERTMEELLRAPTEGDVPNDAIKLMMFPYSLEGNARLWYEDLCAWERFKEMLRACPHHGFTELTQVDTFYNGLNDNDQDSLNAAAGGNLLSKTTREALNIIENKSKVRYSRNKPNASRMNTTSRESVSKTDERIDKLADQLSTLVEIVSKKVVTPAPVKAVEETCVTCGGAHSWYNCPNTDNNQASVCAATGSYNQVNPPNRVSNQMAPPGFAPVQNNGQNRFNNQRSGINVIGEIILWKIKIRETEETTDKQQYNFQGVTAQIPPPVTPISIPESDVPKTLPKTTPILESDVPKSLPKLNIPYPSVCDQSRDKASNQMEKIFQIFQDLRFDISFADALLLMPRFALRLRGKKGYMSRLDDLGREYNSYALFPLKTKLSIPELTHSNDFRVSRMIHNPSLKDSRSRLRYSRNVPLSTDFRCVDSKLILEYRSLLGRFFVRKIEAYLKDDSISPEIDYADCNPEEDICLIEKLLNNDPFQLPPMDLKQSEVTEAKSSIEEPPELELKDLPSHLEYAYFEENDKLPVIIAKGLKDDEKEALLKVIKSHKRVIAWKITDIKGIDPRFCTPQKS